jgi:hypothetical protein
VHHPIAVQLMANAMSRLREEFSILGLSSLAFSDAPTGVRAFDITPPQAKAHPRQHKGCGRSLRVPVLEGPNESSPALQCWVSF